MARPLRIELAGSYYHLTCRGNERRAIYRDDTDRQTFLTELQDSLRIYQVELHAYVLMDNHFHLLVKTQRANLSQFMRHFNISYTSFFNRRHHRVGHLYQGRYKAIVVERDSYLLELSRYVHLNPVRIATQRKKTLQDQIRVLDRYGWSSLKGYREAKHKQAWVAYHGVLEQIGQSRQRYRKFILEGIQRGYATPWESVEGQVVLGEEKFVERMKEEIEEKGNEREQPGFRSIQGQAPGAVLGVVARYYGVKEEQLKGKRTGLRDERAVALELVYRYGGGIRQDEIGRLFGGLDYTAVSRERKRVRQKAQRDPKLRGAFREIERQMSRIKM